MMRDNELDFSQISDLLTAVPDFELVQQEDADENIINLPFLPLRDIVLFPQMVIPLFIGRQRSLAAIDAAQANDENLVVATQRDTNVLDPTVNDIYLIGTEIGIGRLLRMPDDTTSIWGQGQRRVEIVEFTQWDPYIRVNVRFVSESDGWEANTEGLMRSVLSHFERLTELNSNIPDDAFAFAYNIDEPGWLADFIASTLNLAVLERQELLETFDPMARLHKISGLLAKELDVLELEEQINSQVQQGVDRANREHYLREQMRVIQGELGELDIFSQELHELQETIAARKLPAQVQAKAEKEVARLKSMPPMSPEVGIIQTYLDWILHLPWTTKVADRLDVDLAAEVLDAEHFGLERVKDRILEYIAVKQIASDELRSPILCFVGPPGTGKTSIGRSIAAALGREFSRMSLGGVRDEAAIRGHRRTYVGAMPGRVIQAMRRVGSKNPVMMLDEIDKLTQDFHGDPASALLEVLDPEQNYAFHDHYLDLDFDLSEVIFITTANYLDGIPPALQDRMEVIQFSSYLEAEKLGISRQFLVPKQLEQHGIHKHPVQFLDDGLKMLIRRYTREAGVRSLEREIANVCRKIARAVVEKRPFPPRIDGNKVRELLGPPRFPADMLPDEDEVGVATGVAWTAAGGTLMSIEINLMPGKGNLLLTGQLGDVMQESAQAALTYTRSQAERLKIDSKRFAETDIHVHLPEGAVPKDGPSAGGALATALISAFSNRKIQRDVAMTGEITLRGRILPVGGIREKALAAHRAGVHTFVLPRKNENDLEGLPEELREALTIVLVDRVDEMIKVALGKRKRKAEKRPLRTSRSASNRTFGTTT
ncbi:MAG: endopeptidase La [Chloroflexota bacterium]